MKLRNERQRNGKRERLLVTGGSGTLGINVANMTCKEFEVFATYNLNSRQASEFSFVHLDVRDKQQVFSVIADIKPSMVIHTAAMVNVDYCEDHAEEARLINVQGTENVALACKASGSRMVYISSDGVFDGNKGMYSERDTPHPLNTYVSTKLEGERRVKNWLPDSIIVRMSFYGWGRGSNRASLADWVVGGLRRGETLHMFTDVFFSPIYTGNLTEAMIEMYHKGLGGVYHVGGGERCSKYTFGCEIARAFGFDESRIEASSVVDAGFGRNIDFTD